MSLRRTKIIATIGPVSEKPEVLRALLLAGVNIVRINMSHGTRERHEAVIDNVRNLAAELQLAIAVLIDLQGPKIRVAKFKDGSVQLQAGDEFILDPEHPDSSGDHNKVGVDYKNLAADLQVGDQLLLDDGRILLQVNSIRGKAIICEVKLGGILSDNKGLNRVGGGLSAAALTDKDKLDIKFAAQHKAEYVAVSFPRSAEDISYARDLLRAAGSDADVIAKIERIEAVEDLINIIDAADALMVARGDLGVELGFAELPAVQKRIIENCRMLNKAVITATQMMESMLNNTIPTRAEVADVANAVLEGSDAVMLSAETASGLYPVQVVTAMAEVCLAAERQSLRGLVQSQTMEREFTRVDEAIAMAAIYIADHLDVSAIVALTESGLTPLLLSRACAGIPIYGVTSNKLARGKMSLYRGVYPIDFDIRDFERWEVIRAVISELVAHNILQQGQRVIITRGDLIGTKFSANSLKIVTVDTI